MKRRAFLRMTGMALAAAPLAVVAAKLPLQQWPPMVRIPRRADGINAAFMRQYQREVMRRLGQNYNKLRGFGTVSFPRTLT